MKYLWCVAGLDLFAHMWNLWIALMNLFIWHGSWYWTALNGLGALVMLLCLWSTLRNIRMRRADALRAAFEERWNTYIYEIHWIE